MTANNVFYVVLSIVSVLVTGVLVPLLKQKYGKEKFTFQILEECSVEELDEKESYYIKKFNCVIPNGYNVVDYSEGNHTLYSYYGKDVLDSISFPQGNRLDTQTI